ncbi:MAG TPA: hypothetical protein VGV18_06170 [Verrucomicrobiae bacterium]|nr:hypothetical protein [Verrucomicrobiae bacterium]
MSGRPGSPGAGELVDAQAGEVFELTFKQLVETVRATHETIYASYHTRGVMLPGPVFTVSVVLGGWNLEV